MAEPKKSKPGDLSTLDGNALVARLALVKERAIEDSVAADPYDPIEMNTAKTKAQITAERMDTEAVLDECAVRLLAPPGPEVVRFDAASLAVDEIVRLRAIIKAVAFHDPLGHCPMCRQPHDNHRSGCPWPALAEEAGKP